MEILIKPIDLYSLISTLAQPWLLAHPWWCPWRRLKNLVLLLFCVPSHTPSSVHIDIQWMNHQPVSLSTLQGSDWCWTIW